MRYFAGDKIYGQSKFGIDNLFGYAKREAVGVCRLIIPLEVGLFQSSSL